MMPSFVIRRIAEYDPEQETTEQALDRTIKQANRNMETFKRLLYSGLDSVNISSGGIVADSIAANAITAEKIVANSIDATHIQSGSITGGHISSSTKIVAGTGNNVGVLDGAHSTYRIYAGHSDPASAPFRVSQSGFIEAAMGSFSGIFASQHAFVGTSSSTGSINLALSNSEFATIRAVYTSSGNSLMFGRTTSLGAIPTNLERIDFVATTVYNLGNLSNSGTGYFGGNVTLDNGATLGNTLNMGGNNITNGGSISGDSLTVSGDVTSTEGVFKDGNNRRAVMGHEEGANYSLQVVGNLLEVRRNGVYIGGVELL